MTIILNRQVDNVTQIKSRRWHFYPHITVTYIIIRDFDARGENAVAETMILIPGRSSKQGTSLNKGKLKEEYQEVTTTVEMNQDDMDRLGLTDGDEVRLYNSVGETIVRCKGRKPQDLPLGMLFIAYGPPSSQLMESDTAGSGMPLSKHLKVSIEKVAA